MPESVFSRSRRGGGDLTDEEVPEAAREVFETWAAFIQEPPFPEWNAAEAAKGGGVNIGSEQREAWAKLTCLMAEPGEGQDRLAMMIYAVGAYLGAPNLTRTLRRLWNGQETVNLTEGEEEEPGKGAAQPDETDKRLAEMNEALAVVGLEADAIEVDTRRERNPEGLAGARGQGEVLMMTAADLYWAHMEALGHRDIARVFQLLAPELRAKYHDGAVQANEQGWTKKTAVEVLCGRRKSVVEGRDAAETERAVTWDDLGELACALFHICQANLSEELMGEMAAPLMLRMGTFGAALIKEADAMRAEYEVRTEVSAEATEGYLGMGGVSEAEGLPVMTRAMQKEIARRREGGGEGGVVK